MAAFLDRSIFGHPHDRGRLRRDMSIFEAHIDRVTAAGLADFRHWCFPLARSGRPLGSSV